MRKVATILLSVILVGGTVLVTSQAPDAVITIRQVSWMDVDEMGLSAMQTNLDVVGRGELVYLVGSEASGETPVLFTWSIPVAPAGSVITLDSTQTEWFTFRPDLIGTYTVQLNIITNSGTATTTQDIVASEYVGVGSMGGLAPDAALGQCANCHPGNTAGYFDTKHAHKLEKDLNTRTSYADYCFNCHTLGFNEDTTAVNGGFDDVVAETGWTIPDPMGDPGNWASLVANFPEVAQKSNIQCENCHGPGSQHKGDRTKIGRSVDAELCARCHDANTGHQYYQWENSKHAEGVAFAANYTGRSYPAADGFSCTGCHSTYGFIARMDPASDLTDDAGVPQVSGQEQITCVACHDPHSKENENQLRRVADVTLMDGTVVTKGGLGKFCMNCHHAREGAEIYLATSHSTFRGSHYNPQADVLMGTGGVEFGRTLPNSTHKDVLENTCVSCHMYAGPARGEPLAGKLGEHSFNISYTDENGVTTDNVARCITCHEPDMESFDDRMAREDYDEDGVVEAAQDEVRGLLDMVAVLLPPLGEPTFDNKAELTNLQAKGAWNYLFIVRDKSSGVHNFQYAVNLLLLTRDALTYGVLTEGEITDVTDVPNDNGRQVNVSWTRFGGDGVSDAPVEVYYVWRNDGEATLAGKKQADYATLSDVPTADELTTASVMFGGAMWTQVGVTPSAMMDAYNAVVPTLYDSTAAGAAYTEFMVTGHTATSTVFASTDVVSGYSIDNLVPAAPAAVVASAGSTGIVLRWEESVDSDFDYFAVYRGTESGFTPGDEPLATLTGTEYTDIAVDPLATYFYRLAAFDFTGNQGAFSGEISASMATAIAVAGEVPNEYTLYQNYPNPFNPTTQIEYAVPEAGNVRIMIYDISGKEVTVLVDEYVSAGRYVVPWSASNLASGVYFYRMDAGSYTRTQTMLLIK